MEFDGVWAQRSYVATVIMSVGVRDERDVDDGVQEVYTRVATNISKFRDTSDSNSTRAALLRWLAAIARNWAISYRRKRVLQQGPLLAEHDRHWEPEAPSHPDYDIRDHLHVLTREQRDVIERILAGERAVTSRDQERIKKLKQRAIQRLREDLRSQQAA
jgi:DNA-directed RNA polymerase specialized sigma24 family protein